MGASTEISWILTGQPHEKASVQQIAITAQPFTIGRHPDNDLCISNPTVSGHHAELVLVEDDVYVRDLDSTNGTRLNGRSLQTLTGLRCGDMLHFGNVMFTLQRAQGATTNATVSTDVGEDAIAHVQFNKLITDPGVWPSFQPIVRLEDGFHIGYEILARSQFVGLETPEKMFRVAAQRTSAPELSRVCRAEALRAARLLGREKHYYLNTHPAEIETPELLKSLTELRNSYPGLPILLEVHESAVTSTDYLRELRSILNDLEIGLAYDDFGSGQARLMELVEVPPDVLKFDIKLIQGLPSASVQRRSMIESLIQIVLDLGVVPLAEGVEKDEEATICRELGFELAQGYLFGRPQPVKTWLESPED
jgi:EAL domain-containing protein (putative c-di-GMP-specific phosphodiesterase class I)